MKRPETKAAYTSGLMVGMVILAFSAVTFAQTAERDSWGRLKDFVIPNPRADKTIPRTKDGKPDITGIWLGARSLGTRNMQLDLTPWGTDKYTWNVEPVVIMSPSQKVRDRVGRVDLDPVYHCYPPGLVRIGPPADSVQDNGTAIQILQTPGKVVIVYEHRGQVRYIYTDGRQHPKPLEETWNGNSIGRWDGDTFVVDTVGLREETWLDSVGHEHSAELHVVERLRRIDGETLEVERTLTDPIAFNGSYTYSARFRSDPGYFINENLAINECSQYMVRKPGFGKGDNGLLGIGDHP